MDDLAEVSKRFRPVQIGRYLRLSEDQCDLRARKRITNSTWLYWRDGIVEQLADPDFQVALQDAPPSLYDHLRRLSADSSYDPLSSSR
jgi:hypothetical protein